jgi:hypothetical protein
MVAQVAASVGPGVCCGTPGSSIGVVYGGRSAMSNTSRPYAAPYGLSGTTSGGVDDLDRETLGTVVGRSVLTGVG